MSEEVCYISVSGPMFSSTNRYFLSKVLSSVFLSCRWVYTNIHIISLQCHATLLIVLPGIAYTVWCFKEKKEIKMMYNGASGVQLASGIQESHKSDLLSSVVLISCQVTIRFDQ